VTVHFASFGGWRVDQTSSATCATRRVSGQLNYPDLDPHYRATAGNLAPMIDEQRHRIRVLIVDDNAVIRRALRGIVQQDEALLCVGEATSGEGALEVIGSARPDVICLDVSMPGVGGLAVLEALRDKQLATRVVMISGHSSSQVVRDAINLGAKGFVVKPFNAAKVLHAIHDAFAAT